MKEELKKQFNTIMKEHYFTKNDPELPYDNILSCMEDAYNLYRPTPSLTAGGVLDRYHHFNDYDRSAKDDILKAMEVYATQTTAQKDERIKVLTEALTEIATCDPMEWNINDAIELAKKYVKP